MARICVIWLAALAGILAACTSPPTTPAEPCVPCVGVQPDPEPKPEPVKPRWRTDIVITGGVHGNEPSGAAVLPELKEMGFITFGPCNPWGLKNKVRWLDDKNTDLNRMFAVEDCAEAEAVREFLRKNPPGLLLDLHEDPGGTHPYLIQNGPEDDLGRKIIEALKDRYDWDPKPAWWMVEGKDGLLKPDRQMLTMQAWLKIWSLGFYAWYKHGCTAFTVEVPGSWKLERKIEYHLLVCETARRIFSEAHPPE